MSEQSIAAYDVSQRVKTYDADMELMHPNRSKMVQIALEVLPFPKTAALRVIDLGIGTGYFTECFLNKFPNSRVLGIDGAPAMIDLAKATRQFLVDLELKEADQPLTLAEDLALLRGSGLKNVSAFWLEYREVVIGGQK